MDENTPLVPTTPNNISVHNTSVTSTRDHPSRLIFVNNPLGKRKYKYCDNSISTTQFTFK